MRKLLCLVLILLLPLCALAEGDLPAWDYPVAPEILQDPNDYIRLANRENLLDGSYVPSDLVRVTAKHVSGTFQLRKAVNDALLTMFAAANQDGCTLYVKSAYRSYQTQRTMYYNRLEKNGGKDDGWVSYPGASDHQTGLGCDIVPYEWRDKGMNEKMAATEECQWMAAHCAEYGFILRYPEDKQDITEINYEPWHLRYVGNPAATYIMENGLCLEEFHQQLQEAIDLFLQDGGRESLVRDLIQVSADDQ